MGAGFVYRGMLVRGVEKRCEDAMLDEDVMAMNVSVSVTVMVMRCNEGRGLIDWLASNLRVFTASPSSVTFFLFASRKPCV